MTHTQGEEHDVTLTILQGDCRAILPTIESGSVQMCMTSPPYFGLRDYSTATWDGGDAACDHIAGMARNDTERETPGGRGGSFRGGTVQYRGVCGKCGAVRIDNQIGLEATPDLYIAALVDVFREVKRVLRPDGVLWVVIGDSYINKQLQGVPWRVAFALQADGWVLRSDCIWSKPNVMPSSVTDRPTTAHEYLFLLSKSPKYFFDADAIREGIPAVIEQPNLGNDSVVLSNDFGLKELAAVLSFTPTSAADSRCFFEICVRLASTILDRSKLKHELPLSLFDTEIRQQRPDNINGGLVGSTPDIERAAILAARFLKADIAPKQFLQEFESLRITLPNCNDFGIVGGIPFVQNTPGIDGDRDASIGVDDSGKVGQFEFIHNHDYTATGTISSNRKGFVPSQAAGAIGIHERKNPALYHGRNKRSVWTVATTPYGGAHFATFPEKLIEPCILAGSRPGDIVLDPFFGTGTTGRVALKHGRRCIGIDLNPDYITQAEGRTDGVQMVLP